MLTPTRSRLSRSRSAKDAIERLYQVFARYRAPVRLDASPLRDADAILRALRSAPLRELGAEQVLPYAGWALTTVGTEDEYQHFFPRIFELALDGAPYLGAEPAIMADKLRRAGFERWGDDQREAVRAAFGAAWACALARDPAERDATCWLPGLAILGDVTDALDTWRRTSSPYAPGHLATLVQQQGGEFWNGDRVGGAFWDGLVPEEPRRQVMAWLRDPALERWLDDAERPGDFDAAWRLDGARRLLRARPSA